MNLDEMTDEQKSRVLLKLIGVGGVTANLYNPLNMAMAWQVLNWAYTYKGKRWRWFHDALTSWWDLRFSNAAISLEPAEVQRAWLDKILKLAVEAGMVDAIANETARDAAVED